MKATKAPEAPPSPIRVRPIPDSSPPIIDSRTAVVRDPSPFIQGTLAIGFTGDQAPVVGHRDRGPRAGPGVHGHNHDPEDPQNSEYFERQRTFSRDLPEPHAWVRHMAQALVEVMSGARPAAQVIRWTTPEVYSVLARRNAVSSRRTVVARRAIVRRVRICEPVDGVVEACAVVLDNGRVRALAMRLTGVDRRWVISELQVG